MKVQCFDVTYVKASEMPVNPQKVQPTDNVFFDDDLAQAGYH